MTGRWQSRTTSRARDLAGAILRLPEHHAAGAAGGRVRPRPRPQAIGHLIDAPQLLAVRADFPANNFAEFIRYVKANPGKVNYASSGNGSLQHVTTELLKDLTKSGWGCCVRAANIKADRSFS